MASRDDKKRDSGGKEKASGAASAKPAAKASAGSLVTAQLLSQLKNTAQKTSSTSHPYQDSRPPEPAVSHRGSAPAPAPVDEPVAYMPPPPEPAPAPALLQYAPEPPQEVRHPQSANRSSYAPEEYQNAHPGGGHARVISITLTPYDLQLCERIRARFLDTTLAPSRSEILKLALHALDLDDDGLITALLAVRERDGRRRKLEPGQKAPSAHYPALPVEPVHPAPARPATGAYPARPGR